MVKVIPVKSAMRGTCESVSGTPASSMRTRMSSIGAEVTRARGTPTSMSAVTRAAAPGISAILPAVRTISSRAKRS